MFRRLVVGCTLSLAMSCTCGVPAAIAPPSTPVAPPSSNIVVAPPSPPAQADVLWVTELYAPGLDEPSDDAATLGGVAITPPRPATASGGSTPTPLGELFEHEGHYHVDALGDVPAPYPTITRIGRDGTCDAPVTRAVEARVLWLDGDDASDDARLVLFVGDCAGAGISSNAVGGSPARWRALALETASTAPTAVTTAVRARSGDESAPITAIALSAPDAFVAYDGAAWYVVLEGAVQWSPAVAPLAEVTLRDRVLVLASSSEEDSLRAIDDADPQ